MSQASDFALKAKDRPKLVFSRRLADGVSFHYVRVDDDGDLLIPDGLPALTPKEALKLRDWITTVFEEPKP